MTGKSCERLSLFVGDGDEQVAGFTLLGRVGDVALDADDFDIVFFDPSVDVVFKTEVFVAGKNFDLLHERARERRKAGERGR